MPGELAGFDPQSETSSTFKQPELVAAAPSDGQVERAARLSELDTDQRGGRHDRDAVTDRDLSIIRNRQQLGLAADDDWRSTSTEAPRRAVERAATHERWLADFLDWAAQGEGETDETRMRRVSERLRGMTADHRQEVAAATNDARLAYWATPEPAVPKLNGPLGLPQKPGGGSRAGFSSRFTASHEAARARPQIESEPPRSA